MNAIYIMDYLKRGIRDAIEQELQLASWCCKRYIEPANIAPLIQQRLAKLHTQGYLVKRCSEIPAFQTGWLAQRPYYHFLYYSGNIDLINLPSLAIIGSVGEEGFANGKRAELSPNNRELAVHAAETACSLWTSKHKDCTIITGGARGCDRIGMVTANSYNIPTITVLSHPDHYWALKSVTQYLPNKVENSLILFPFLTQPSDWVKLGLISTYEERTATKRYFFTRDEITATHASACLALINTRKGVSFDTEGRVANSGTLYTCQASLAAGHKTSIVRGDYLTGMHIWTP